MIDSSACLCAKPGHRPGHAVECDQERGHGFADDLALMLGHGLVGGEFTPFGHSMVTLDCLPRPKPKTKTLETVMISRAFVKSG
jgi:hypothetical protein